MTDASLIEKLTAEKEDGDSAYWNNAIDCCIAIVRQHQPTPISLEKCVFAAWQNALHAERGDIIGTTLSKRHCEKIAKAVLDAAGVPYE